LVPYAKKGLAVTQSSFWQLYMQYGKTPKEIFLFLLTHPLRVFSEFFSKWNITWYKDLFGIWGGFAIFSPQILLPAMPLFLKNVLSSDLGERVVVLSYYSSVFMPFIFLAVWNTLNRFKNKWRMPLHALVIVMMTLHALHYMPRWMLRLNAPDITDENLIKYRLTSQIPPDASVLSAWSTLGLLADRKELYPVRFYLRGSHYISEKKFALPKNLSPIIYCWILIRNGTLTTPIGNLFL
jgi:hypothetical protein